MMVICASCATLNRFWTSGGQVFRASFISNMFKFELIRFFYRSIINFSTLLLKNVGLLDNLAGVAGV